MARITKASGDGDAGNAPGLADDVRKFIIYAGDLISEQQNMRQELMAARSDMAAVAKAYERTHRVIAKRETDGVAVHIGSCIDDACLKIEHALSEPIGNAEQIARELRLTAFLSGLLGALVGGSAAALMMI
jgi:hypothetical protein